jgi:hypothetical protein
VLLICLAVWLGLMAQRRQAENQAVQTRIEQLQARQAALAAAKPTRTEIDLQKRWTTVKLERDFPWVKVFQAVERASSKDIELLEFQPDKRNRLIVLRGEAKDQTALVSYLESLAMQASLANVHLLHQETVTRNRLETISFEIKATLIE